MMAGPHISPFGDVISSALNMDGLPSAAKELHSKFSLQLGQIAAIYTVDDESGLQPGVARKNTLYDVIVMTGSGAMEMIPRCRMVQPAFGGGLTNFFEILPTDPGFQGNDPTVDWDLKRGSRVLVGFVDGKKDTAVILGTMPSPGEYAVSRRPTKGMGAYMEGEFQGLNFVVNNEGALAVTFNGPRNDSGDLANQNGPTSISITKDGNVSVSTNNQQTVLIDRVAKTIKVTNGPTYINMDQNANKVQVVAGVVETGTGALQPQVVGDDWKKLMERLIAACENIIVPTGVGPSGHPINKDEFEGIKSDLKNALSTKHKVEK
jgi:hypothetical protein